MAEFTIPEFLQGCSVDEVFEEMKSILPKDIDVSEGGHAWNMTRPTALVIAKMCEFILPEVIKVIFPEWSYGQYLDGHAKMRNLTRRPATVATGEITITGAEGTKIPAGSIFSTASINDEPSIDYETTEAATIPNEGSVTVKVQCKIFGLSGNTAANTIIIPASKITGITSVTNTEAVTGGTPEEEDETLQQRIMDYDQAQSDSFTGSPSDYKRWASSVPGVGVATVIPASDTSGLVTIILTDANGEAATEALCTKVYNYIMSPDDPGSRLAPCNAYLSVQPPETIAIYISAGIELTSGSSISAVKNDLKEKVMQYLPQAMDDREVKYTRIAAILSAVTGVNDFKDLKIGTMSESGTVSYGTSNISVTNATLPTVTLDSIVLTEATV